MSDVAWLQSLKTGDRVILSPRMPSSPDRIVKIRCTKTQIIADAVRFSRVDGHRIGDMHSAYLGFTIKPYSEEAAKKVRRQQLNSKVLSMMDSTSLRVLESLSDQEIADLYQALERAGL